MSKFHKGDIIILRGFDEEGVIISTRAYITNIGPTHYFLKYLNEDEIVLRPILYTDMYYTLYTSILRF